MKYPPSSNRRLSIRWCASTAASLQNTHKRRSRANTDSRNSSRDNNLGDFILNTLEPNRLYSMARTVYIYILRDPCDNSIRYCGQCLNPNRRLRKHLSEARKKIGRLTHKEAWIKSLGEQSPILEIIETCDETIVDEREIYHIQRLREEGTALTNIAIGGKCGIVLRGKDHPHYGTRRSDDVKHKISLANSGKNNGMYGRTYVMTSEHKEAICSGLRASDAMKTRNANPTWRENISKAQRTYRQVELVSVKTGQRVQIFSDMWIAAETLGCSRCNLKHAINDQRPIGKRLKSLNEECYVRYVE